MTRILRNLIDNALLAVQPTGRVEITVRRLDSNLEACVADDGPGIPREERERIFERFVRLDQANRTGTGLGLAIACVGAHAQGQAPAGDAQRDPRP